MGENDFILSIFIGFGYIMLLLIYYRLLTCTSNRVYDDVDSVFSGDDDDHDRGIGFSDDHVTITIKDLAGIDPSVLQAIPVVDFNSRDFKDGFKCIVCLSNLSDGDRTRLLPACNHWFHADCIDTWLQSHSTCPICRTEVGSVQRGTRPELGYEGLTTNVAVTQDASSGEAISYCDEHREHMRRLL